MSLSAKAKEEDIVLEKFYRKCRRNYIFAARALLIKDDAPVELFAAQKAMLLSMQLSFFIIIVASRGFGKTFIMAVFAVLKCLLNPREKVGITGPTFRQAKFVFAEIQRLYSETAILQESCKREPVMGSDMCRLEFKNGSFIQALPLGDGEKIRGARFNTMLVDEAVKVPQDILDRSILPMMSTKKNPMESVRQHKLRRDAIARGEDGGDIDQTGNQIVLCTSAWFQIAALYTLLKEWKSEMEAGNTRYKVLSFSYLEAPEGFFDMEFVKMTKKTVSKIKFAMEWLAYWPRDTEGFFPVSLFEGARGTFNIEVKGVPGEKYGISIDPARESDNFIINVTKLGTVSKLVYSESASPVKDVSNPNGWKNLHDSVRRVFREFNSNGAKVVGIALDQGGGGSIIRDMLSEPYEWNDGDGNLIIEPRILEVESAKNKVHDEVFINSGGLRILHYQNWNTEWINQTAWRLKSMLEKRELLIPTPIMTGDNYSKGRSIEVEEEDKRSARRLKKRMLATDIRDIVMDDVEETIYECSNIVTNELPTRKGYYNFSTPKASLKKDRWAALMLMAHLIYELKQQDLLPKRELAESGVVTKEIIGLGEPVQASRGNVDVFSKLEKEEENINALLQANKMLNSSDTLGSIRFNADAAALAGRD